MRSNMAGAGFYNSEPRNFNRGFGRGNWKPYQSSHPPPSPSPSPQPPRRGDVFIEAGRLAVEYLVSHGLLSSNVLPDKCENGNLKSNNGEPQDHRSSQDRELPNSLEARSSASARPRTASPDGVSSSRRSPSDQDLSRKSLRERRKYGDSRSYSSDWSRENGREVSLVEKVTPSQAMEVDYEKHPKGSTKDGDSDVCISHSSESANKDGSQGDLHPVTGVDCPVDSCSKAASSLPSTNDEELPKSDGGVNKETNDDTGNEDKEQGIQKDESHIQQSEKTNDSLTQDQLDVTEVNSSLVSKSMNSEPVFSSVEKTSSEIGHDHPDPVKDASMSSFSGNPPSNEIPSSNVLGNAFSDGSCSGVRALVSFDNVNPIKSGDFLSGTGKTSSHEQKSSGLPELQMSCSDPKDRGEKRAHAEGYLTDGLKKAKQWLSVAQSNEYLELAKSEDEKPIAQQEKDATTFSESPNQACRPRVSLPQNGGLEPGINQAEEMQLFASSYKTCDLNLMEASDMHENHGAAVLLYPSVSAPKKEANIDIDLSMTNNFNFTNAYNDVGSVRKDVEIIDLEDSSLEEGKRLMSTRNAESMESFANKPHNPSDNPEGQDGYGFMISELLGNDVPNCSSAQPDMDSLHNDMGLHHGEGMFNEDDPIYMSLGEIPLSLLQGWEQPSQERNPFDL